MTSENIMFDLGFYFTNFFPMSDVFSSNDLELPLILVESESDETRALFKTSFMVWKYNILESADFAETQSLIISEKPQIILLDCVSSLETLIKLRILRENKISSQIPIIVFSDIEELIKEKEILNAGADDLLLKPINFQELETSINREIENYNQDNFTFGGFL